MRAKTYTHWRWYLSAVFYRFTYNEISHQLDEDLFTFLGDRIKGAVLADCGCGPGVVAEKFLKRGISKVFVIDVNSQMVEQTKRRLAFYTAADRVETICSEFDESLFEHLKISSRQSLNIVLFKRSLYCRPPEAAKILSAASSVLAPDGMLIVVHPDRSLQRYAFGADWQWQSYTAYHLFNRTISWFADWAGIGQYTTYDETELIALLCAALPGFRVYAIPTAQQAFNLIVAHKPTAE